MRAKSAAALSQMATAAGSDSDYQRTNYGLIPKDWSIQPLDAIAFVTSGKRLPPGYVLTQSATPFPYIRVSDMENGTVDTSDLRYVPVEAAKGISRYRIFKADIYISVAGTLGLVGMIPPELDGANLTENADRITDILCSQKYLMHVLLSPVVQGIIDGVRTVGAQPKLALTRIRKFPIPLPDNPFEQDAIATALSDVDALIESLSLLLAKKREIKQGVMQELLTGKRRLPGFSGKWEVKVLGRSASLKARIGWQGLTTKEYLSIGDFYLVTGTELQGGEIDWDQCNHVEAARYKQDQNIQLGIDDVLLTKDGTIGKVGIVTALPKPATLNSGIFVIRPLARAFHPRFFYYLLCSRVFTEFLEQLAAGSTINHLYQKDFVNFSFHLPPTEDEQKAIAEVLADLDSDIAAVEARLAKARDFKQGMMQELLTGRIRLVRAVSNVIPLHANPAAGSSSPKQPSHNWQINEAVVIGVLAQRFGTEKFPLSRKRRVKLMYLLHRHAEGQADGYLKKAAGPYDPNTKYKGPEQIALKNGYVRSLRNNKYEGFVAGDKIEQAQRYFKQWYGAGALVWLERFRYRKTDELELLATVDMALVDLVAAGVPADVAGVKRVIAAHPEWLPKLSRDLFSDERIASAIAECQTLFSGPPA